MTTGPLIHFCGKPLPKWCGIIDLAANNRAVEVSENTAIWWWRFPICVGVQRTASSADVVNQCTALAAALRHPALRAWLVHRLLRAHIDTPAESLLQAWEEGRRLMIDTASVGEICEWTGILASEI